MVHARSTWCPQLQAACGWLTPESPHTACTQDALAAVRYLNGTSLDERPIRVDIDYGFEEGRQFGRGRSGGQVRAGVYCTATQ